MADIDKSYRDLMRRAGDLTALTIVCEEQNLTRAASRLGISQPSLSKRMRNIELFLGCTLFDRTSRGLEPTEIALRFVSDIKTPISQLSGHLNAARQDDGDRKILIAADFAFASFWLIPRITRMQSELGIDDIQVLSSQTPQSSGAQADLTIYLSDPAHVSEGGTALLAENVCAVAAPRYIDTHGPLRDLADLERHRFIHLTNPSEPMQWFDWTSWLEAATGTPASKPPGAEVNSYEMVLKLARTGQGLALGWAGMVDEFLATGELVKASNASIASERAYFIDTLQPSGTRIVEAARKWIIADCASPDHSARP